MRSKLTDGVDIIVTVEGRWFSVYLDWGKSSIRWMFAKSTTPAVAADNILSDMSGRNVGTHANLAAAIKSLLAEAKQ